MALLEVLTINLGAALIKVTAKAWLGDSWAEAAVAPLTETLKKAIPDFETRWAAEQLFTDLQSKVAQRLATVIERLFPAMPENEQRAAVLAVSEVFERISVQKDIFESELDAVRLEAIARPHTQQCFRMLGSETEAFARFLLRESCNFAVALVGKMPNFQVAASREILKRHRELSADLEKVLETVLAMRRDASEAGMREAQNFELQYRRALVQRLDRLELFGLRLIGAGAREYPLSVAYVTLTATGDSQGGLQRVDDALAGKSRMLTRGEAGSGKSTLLQWLAVRAANRDFEAPLESWNERIPIYIRLRDYAEWDLPPPENFIEGTARNLLDLMPDRWAHTVLRSALVLVDGIDELPANRRRAFVSWMRDLTSDFPDALFAVTSRPAALDSSEPILVGAELGKSGYVSLILEPMALADSEALVAQWHSAVARDRPEEAAKLESYERDLRQSLRDRPAIRNLASNPLLCSMICALNWDRRQRLPDDRMELYRLALEMLLERRDEERAVQPAYIQELNRSEREELLDEIAYWMLRNRYSEAKQERVEEQIGRILPRFAHINANASQLLQELLERSGILRRPQYGTIDFIHRTFLEYMAARAAIAAGDIGALVEGASDESWREAVVFAAGHAKGKSRADLVEELLRRPWFRSRPLQARVTAACCLETVGRNLDPQLLKISGISRGACSPLRTLKPQEFSLLQRRWNPSCYRAMRLRVKHVSQHVS
jgi:hypothetical protein